MRTEPSGRTWAAPERPWAMRMVWHDLLFASWPVRAEVLRPLIPPALSIDTFDGEAWISIVPFRMTGVLPRGVPALPGLSAFAELNVRTYVTIDDKPGVWFFSLDAANRIAVWAARRTFHLPYYYASMSATHESDGICYASDRRGRGDTPACFEADYRPAGEATATEPGTIEHWLTSRFCLYAASGRSQIWRGEIDHAPWPLQRAEAEITSNSMVAPLGIVLPDTEPLLGFSRRVDVVAWSLDAMNSFGRRRT